MTASPYLEYGAIPRSVLYRGYDDKNSRGCLYNGNGFFLLARDDFFLCSHFEMKISSIINNHHLDVLGLGHRGPP